MTKKKDVRDVTKLKADIKEVTRRKQEENNKSNNKDDKRYKTKNIIKDRRRESPNKMRKMITSRRRQNKIYKSLQVAKEVKRH